MEISMQSSVSLYSISSRTERNIGELIAHYEIANYEFSL
jgi:hypothetical protein